MDIDYTVGEVELTYKSTSKAGIKYIVRRMLMKSYFQHIERELSVTKNTSKSCS